MFSSNSLVNLNYYIYLDHDAKLSGIFIDHKEKNMFSIYSHSLLSLIIISSVVVTTK